MAELAPLGVLNGFSELQEQRPSAEVLSEASTSGQDSEIENRSSSSYILHKVRACQGGRWWYTPTTVPCALLSVPRFSTPSRAYRYPNWTLLLVWQSSIM